MKNCKIEWTSGSYIQVRRRWPEGIRDMEVADWVRITEGGLSEQLEARAGVCRGW